MRTSPLPAEMKRAALECQLADPARADHAAVRPRGCARRPALVGLEQLLEAAERLAVDHDLGKGHVAGERRQLAAADRVLGEVDLLEHELALREQLLRADAARARDPSCRAVIWGCPLLGFHPVLAAKCRSRRGGFPCLHIGNPSGAERRRRTGGRLLQDGGDRASLDAPARGRPHRPPVHRHARQGGRRREGRAPHEVAFRRAARALLPGAAS